MKKLILAFFLFSIFHVSNAQEEEVYNKFVVGGSINFSSQNNTNPITSLSILSGIGGVLLSGNSEFESSSFALTPYIGKEINSHWLAGVVLEYRNSTYTVNDFFVLGQGNSSEFKRNLNQLGIGLFSRYMVNPKNNVIFFLQPAVEYNTLRNKDFLDNLIQQEEKTLSITAQVELGIVYNLSDKVRLLLRNGGLLFISGQSENVDTGVTRDFSSFSTNLNLSSVFFGVELRL